MTRPVVVFVVVAYLLSIALSVAVGLTGGQASPIVGLGFSAMFFPTIAVLVVRFAMGEKIQSLGLDRFPVRYLPVVLLMPAVMHGVMLPLTAVLEGGLHWQAWLTPGGDGLFHTPESRGWGTLTATALMGRIAANAVVGVLVMSFLAFFEEVGWRAWLLPRLTDRLGARRAVVIASVIWALWHTPFALSGIHYLDGVSQGATAAIMPAGHVGAGLILGWLWQRSESMWLVALAHGALNNWGQYAFKYLQDFVAADPALVLGAGNAALLLVGCLFVSRGFGSGRAPEPPSTAGPDVLGRKQAVSGGIKGIR